ncbi:inactive serine protease 39-like [Ochotona princeps]|uniref:inactive serine protease 39-like n=1 Tax=Ochotona princeps TaxID=9978 RepID=UPI0027150AF5|nr:inactive serine protease 39-like [Ochotona princeps]
MTVHKVIVHEDYNRKYRFGSNITLPQLNVPVDFNSHILSACLPDNSAVVPMNSSCWISGWGRLTEDVFLPAPFHLQEAKVSLIDQDRCEKFYIPHPAIPPDQAVTVQEDMICAGDTKVEKGICREDSGGPLSCFLNGAWHVVGLSSWNWDCRSPIGYSVFVRITYFANWIKEKQRVNPAPNPSSAPPQEKPPAMTNNPIPEVGTVCQPSFFLLLLLSATVHLQLVLQSL